MQALARKQGLGAVVLDGIEKLRAQGENTCMPEKSVLTQWIGEVLQDESAVAVQQNSASKMAYVFHNNDIKTYVLKGLVIAECYPKPSHRRSADMDCFLQPSEEKFDAWELGNQLMEDAGFEVKRDYYKNSTIYIPGLMVENHQFMTPYRGNKRMTRFETQLQNMITSDKGKDKFEGTYLYRPPVMMSALFLIEHAYSHFLHEGLTWRHILDWMMFSKKHKDEIDWHEFDGYLDEYGFRKFYDSYYRLGKYLLGEVPETDLTEKDNRMLNDVWDDLDLHESDHGLKGKLALAGNTWRASWKYRYFSEISMLHALWIQVKGFLFMKKPKLD